MFREGGAEHLLEQDKGEGGNMAKRRSLLQEEGGECIIRWL